MESSAQKNDNRIKNYLIEKSKNGYAILSVYNPDRNAKNRRNSKKSRYFQELIINAGFSYKKIQISHNKMEIENNYIVFDKFDDGFNETGIRLKEFIENCEKDNHFSFFTVINTPIEEYLIEKEFYHPLLKSEKQEYIKRKEVILTDLWEPPEEIGSWRIRKVYSENSVLYACHNILCSISLQPDGKWLRHYGTITPIGASIKKEYAESKSEAFSNLWNPYRK